MDPPLHSAEPARGSYRRGVCFASLEAPGSVGGVDRGAVGRQPGEASDQTPAAASRPVVYVSGSTGRSFRQQSRRAESSSCRDHPEKQLLQPESAGGQNPSGSDERLSHPETTRSGPHRYGGPSPVRIRKNRQIASPAVKNHCKRLKYYQNSSFKQCFSG